MSTAKRCGDADPAVPPQVGRKPDVHPLIQAHGDRVYGLALRMTRSESQAAQIAQEVFLTAPSGWSGSSGAEARVLTGWLTRATITRALSRARSGQLGHRLEPDAGPPRFDADGTMTDEVDRWSFDAADDRLKPGLSAAIERSAEELPEQQRWVLLLRDVEGLSYEEVAELTGASVAATKRLLHLARLALRSAINAFHRSSFPAP